MTAAMLRAAHGTVRCGRCGSAFDALERLSDTIPPVTPESQPIALVAADLAAVPEPTAGGEYHFSAEDLERVFVEASDWRDPFRSSSAAPEAALEPADAGAEAPLVVVDEGTRFEDITLEGERIRIEAPPDDAPPEHDLDSTDELEILRHVPESAYPDDEDAIEREIEALAQQFQQEPAPEPATAAPAAVQPAEPAPATVPVPELARDQLPLAAQRWRRPIEESEPEPAERTSTWGAVAWSLGGLVLAVVLAAQVIHHFRQDLVRHPLVGPPLRVAYERLGLDLLPNWDLAAFELRQWGNDAAAAAQGRMVVRASLTNRAAFAQPHPILRLELEDRFGATVATRDFEPADYLKNPSQGARLVAPGSSSEAELLLADPGIEAVGYRLDVCLRESASLLRCARGPG
ncbi:MAG: DUF3426 domain-containing protein [Steroidobacteraceae bacterium]|nr:DUF3426 domain-containing protein [Steroidobacteraceae bacterium]